MNKDNKSFQNEAQTPIEKWYPNGQKQSERYCIDGKEHRLDGPSGTYWFSNGQKQSEDYYINGKCHRLNGPSSTVWYPNGQKQFEWYYIDGNFQTSKHWDK